jgi:hypothetical protein
MLSRRFLLAVRREGERMATTKRKRRTERSGRITPEALAAYRAGKAKALHRALHLPPWQVSPLRASGPCPWPPSTAGGMTWADSVRLRAELEAASEHD